MSANAPAVSYWKMSGPLGWFWSVDGRESARETSDLAEQVAAAIVQAEAASGLGDA